MGTLVYPNALAGVILLLLPVPLALAFNSTRQMKPPIRSAVIVMTCLLGALGLVWFGSKAGWLLALALIGVWLFRLNWPARLKWTTLATVLVVGLAVFALRFHNYFAAGATSVGARFDYWRAAVQITRGRTRCSAQGLAHSNGLTRRLNRPTPRWPGWRTTIISNNFPIPESWAAYATRRGSDWRW